MWLNTMKIMNTISQNDEILKLKKIVEKSKGIGDYYEFK